MHRNATPETEEPVNTDTTIGSMQQADLAKLIADQIAAAIPTIAAHSGFTSGSGVGCTYKSFLSCQTHTFKGTDGATSVIQWMESIESVIRMSGCAPTQAVTYTTWMFQGPALTWWTRSICPWYGCRG
jgi:hypothetical protein